MRRFILILTLVFIAETAAAQLQIKSLECKGEVPVDIRKSFAEFIDSQSNSEFETKSLLGVYSLLTSGNLVFGDETHQFLNRVASKIMAANGINAKLHFYVLRSGLFNAFTTDDGYIFASTALLAQVESEDELAFVLSHEISHYLLHHNLQMETKRKESIEKAIEEIRAKRKQRKQKKKINKKDFDVSLDKLLRSYFEYSRSQEYQADSLGLEMYVKAGYAPLAAGRLIEKLAHPFPVFERYQFEPSGLIASNLKAADFIKRRVNYLNNKSKTSKNAESDTGQHLEVDSIRDLYSTHPDYKLRYNALKDRITAYAATSDNTVVPVDASLRFRLLSEQYIFMMQQNYFHLSAAYLNIIAQDFPQTADIESWKLFTLIPLIHIRSQLDFSILSNSSYGDDLVSQFMRVYAGIPENTLINAAHIYSQHKPSNVQHEKVRLHYAHYLSELKSAEWNPVKLVWKDEAGSVIEFANEDSVLRKSGIAGLADPSVLPVLVYNSRRVSGYTSEPRHESKALKLMHGNISYRSARSLSGVEIARKTNRGVKWLLDEIIRYGKQGRVSYANVNIANNTALTADDYNTYSRTQALVRELMLAGDPLLRPVGSMANHVNNTPGNGEVCVVFENSYDGQKQGVAYTVINTYISHFGLMMFYDLGGLFDLSSSRYRMTGIVIDTENYQAKYLAVYEYPYQYKLEVISAVAMKFNKDLRRNYK